MIDHVSVETADLARATAFYDAALGAIGYTRLVTREATAGYGKGYPEFWINRRDGAGALPGSGFHVALRCKDADTVRAFHEAALSNGGACDGVPELRPEYADVYYAAFIRDPDGNRIEAVTFLKADKT